MLARLQNLGKALLYPIACMPVAALLMRVGIFAGTFHNVGADAATNIQAILGNIIAAPGNAFFGNLGLFFSIGLAFGLTKDSRGEAALVGALALLALKGLLSAHALPSLFYSHVLTGDFKVGNTTVPSNLSHLLWTVTNTNGKLAPAWNVIPGVLGGIVSGFTTAFLYNRYKEVELPAALGFFSGRRFIPMITTFVIMIVGVVAALILPWIGYVFDLFGHWVVNQSFTSPGHQANTMIVGLMAGIYGVLNRFLLPFGLHHIVNTIFWFQVPFSGGSVIPGVTPHAGQTISAFGDISAFAHGIKGAGVFQSGYFPIMMFGLPAAAAAMIFCSEIENRKATMGILGSAALVSFCTGITEPIEFSFVFLAPALYGLHALLTGIFSFIVVAMNIHIGFGFSAGLFDYLISLPTSWDYFKNIGTIWSNPLWIWPIGAVCAGVYYSLFTFFIKKFDLATPGRHSNIVSDVNEQPEDHKGYNETKGSSANSIAPTTKKSQWVTLSEQILPLLGGNDNIDSIGNCATRLRIIVHDGAKVQKEAIKKLKVFGIITPSKKTVQIIIGPKVEFVANAMKKVTGK